MRGMGMTGELGLDSPAPAAASWPPRQMWDSKDWLGITHCVVRTRVLLPPCPQIIIIKHQARQLVLVICLTFSVFTNLWSDEVVIITSRQSFCCANSVGFLYAL